MAHQVVPERQKVILIAACWVAVVFLFATQWFVYDAARGYADPFRYYLWWSCYTWGVLTPVVVTFAYHKPINPATWKRALPLHLGASLVLVASEISIEAMLGKLRLHHNLSIEEALRHYFTRHTQVSLLTYWMLVGAVQLYRMHDEAQKRELRSSKLEAQLSATQLEVLRAQLHPHFLFNTLQAATMLIHEDPDGAEDILLRLSELLRISIDEANIQEIPLTRELEVLDLYMGIQARRFGDRLQFEVSIDQNVRDCIVPALILQPLVENAIRHGIGRHKGSDTVSVRGFQEAEFLRLEVRNLNSSLKDSPSQLLDRGVGLANTRARLEQLYGSCQEFGLRNLEPTGVCAELSIPLRSAPVLVEEPSR
ncbi:MAG TPA: histidine kinase [Terriglobales bacterium]|nr:histidine kinase [Terriglobales bacterium]